MGLLNEYRRKVRDLLEERGLSSGEVLVSAAALAPREAMGDPCRDDFPILKGKEVMIQARFRESLGQAFTSEPGHYAGSLHNLWNIPLDRDFNRALVVAVTNAALRHLGLVSGTLHCRDDGPQECASRLVDHVTARFGDCRVALIGLQPALLEALAGRLPVRVTDRDPHNVGEYRHAGQVESGNGNPEVIEWADVVLATGTSLVNGTIDLLRTGKPTLFYGVTVAGAATLMNLERYCPCAC
jgi:hypothetical protein